MIQNIKDRVPVNVLSNDAIRYGIYDEQGNLVRYEYIKREDEPTEEGTPINKALFNNFQGDLYTQDRYNQPQVTYEPTRYGLVQKDIIPKIWSRKTDTEYIANDGTILTSSTPRTAERAVINACDGNTSSAFVVNTKTAWLKIKFNNAVKATKMKTFICDDSGNASYLSSVIIQGSNDDTTWDNLYTITSEQKSLIESVLNNPKEYIYYRLNITSTVPTNWNIQVIEWQISEYEGYDYSYVNNLSLPLTSYEVGKIVNIEGSSYIGTQEFTKTGNIFPTSGWNVNTNKIKYSTTNGYIIEADSVVDIGTNDFQVYKVCDNNTNTYWSNANNDAEEHWVKITCPEPIKITKMKCSIYAPSTSSSWVSLQGSKDGVTWNYIGTPSVSTTMTPAPELSEFEVNKPDFYKYYKIILQKNSTLHIYEWQTSEYVEVVEGVEITSFENPYLNINNLGEKQINGTIKKGQRYTLYYTGTNFQIHEPRDCVTGTYTGNGSTTGKTLTVGFKPSAVIIFSQGGNANGSTGGYAGFMNDTWGVSYYLWNSVFGVSLTVTTTETSITFKADDGNAGNGFNANSKKYTYIAFRDI